MNPPLADAPRPTRVGAAPPASTHLPLALAVATTLGSLAFVAPPPMFPVISETLGVAVSLT